MSGTAGTWERAVAWLASAAPDSRTCREEWERNPLGVALLPAGRLWDLLVVGGELGAAALEVLTGCPSRPGPVLADFAGERLGYLVPPGTAESWIGTGVRCVGRGGWVVTPYPGRETGGTYWVIAPDGSGRLTPPDALESALHEAAARRAGGAPLDPP